jgi:hypothetical protein
MVKGGMMKNKLIIGTQASRKAALNIHKALFIASAILVSGKLMGQEATQAAKNDEDSTKVQAGKPDAKSILMNMGSSGNKEAKSGEKNKKASGGKKNYAAEGDSLNMAGDYAGAIDMYKLALKEKGADAVSLNQKLGGCYVAISEFKDAKKAYQSAIDARKAGGMRTKDAIYSSLNSLLGLICLNIDNDPVKAKEYFATADQYGDKADWYNIKMVGTCLLKTGNTDVQASALSSIKTAIKRLEAQLADTTKKSGRIAILKDLKDVYSEYINAAGKTSVVKEQARLDAINEELGNKKAAP